MCILPEPETRNGLSLSHNDAFATITRSTLPTCSFVSTPVIVCEPVRPKAPPLSLVSKPKPGEFFAFNPLSAPISSALATSSDLHSPSGCFQPSGSKRSTGFITNKLALPNARLFFAPRFALFRLRPGSALQTRLRAAGLWERKTRGPRLKRSPGARPPMGQDHQFPASD